jgi:transcriptional regulator with XRE-family HTH domain
MHKETSASSATELDAIAEALRKALANSGETYTSLAAKTGYSRQSLKRWLGKRRDQLTVHTAILIGDALGADALGAEAHS